MLDIEPKFPELKYSYGGLGIFNIAKKLISKTSYSAIAKKIINSATTKNLQKAANSTIGQEIKKTF